VGRKVHPIGFRLGYIKDWDSKWYAEGPEYAELLHEDLQIRNLVHEHIERAGVARIEIERYPKRITVTIHTAKPGVVIGRRGANINELKEKIEALLTIRSPAMTDKSLRLDVVEIDQPELSARVVAEDVALQLERRVSQRRAMRQAIQRTMRAGAEGCRVVCKGRLSGAEMSRIDWMHEGRVPLHTLRADIDFAIEEAVTPYGRIGVKVYIYRGDVLPELEETESEHAVTPL
jgi:small subunit ribosomal protein S3